MTTIQQVELGVLGPLQVRRFGLPVPIPGAKPRAVLTMLGLYDGAVVGADALVELLWGDDPPRTAAKALQTHISALRRALGDGVVLTQGTGWALRDAEVDATGYTAAATRGREAMECGDAAEAVARFDEALALWRGAPELPDGRRGRSERTRWIEAHAAFAEDRADALLATGRAAEIVGELEAAIAEAPLRERRWGQLMLGLYRAGRQGEALAGYQRARTLLADELGVDPGPDLRRLEAAIVAQDISLELPVSQRHTAITRAMTFLLTDIEGSTAAWEKDAAEMAVALARHDEIIEHVVTSRGGRLIKTRGEGDATFSVFDRPSAAAASAVEMQVAMRREPWSLAEPIRIRIALHTGEVEFRDGDYFGRAVNRAARLRSLAAGGQILCSGATAELVIDTLADDVVLADLGTRQLKNLARPERVFELRLETEGDTRAVAVDEPIERSPLPPVLAGPGPFVGRAGELRQLLTAWESTLATGVGAALIAGEPGVGKTRLAGEWSRRAHDDGAFVLYGRCDEDLGAPYQPFAEAMRALVPCLGSSRLRGLRGVEALLALVPGLADVLPDLAPPQRADADTERYALFDAVVGVLGIASASAPVVLVLDDLHWAAKPTLLLLRHLLRFGEHARIQIVGTYRSTDLDRSHPLSAMLADLHRDGSAFRLQLGGLGEDDVTSYVAASGYDDEELARALAAVTGGNPFFLIEALRHVEESGGRWDPHTLPQGVREAVGRRLSRLPVETNRALAAAAVVGSRFAVDLVERVVDADLVDAFDDAAQAGIVIEEPGGRYRFNHAIVRQSLLTELASVRRMRLHQRIAAALEESVDDDVLAELAYHYFECAWAGNAAKAVEYCGRAADQAMTRLAYEGAADLYDKALHALAELDEDLPDREVLIGELLIARCEALLAAGDVTSAVGAVAQLRQVAGDSGRLAAWGACFDGQLAVLTDPERLDDVEAALDAAAATLAGLEDAAGEAKAHTVRATCLGRLGRIGDCENSLDRALTAARRAQDHRRVNAVLANAPLAALWGPNPVPRAGGRCLDVVRLLRITTGSPVVEAMSTRCQGVLDAFRGRANAGRQLVESARRTLSELGTRHALLEVEQFAGIIELVADDPTAAERHLRKAYNGFRRMGLDADTAETGALLARACLALGKDAEAGGLCSESEHLAGHALKASIAWRIVRAQLSARSGDFDAARQVAEEAVAIAERTDALVDHGDACLALATVLGLAGDTAAADVAAERAVGLYELKGAAALAEKARSRLGTRDVPAEPSSAPGGAELANACVRAGTTMVEAVERRDWAVVERLLANEISFESRRKIVGTAPLRLSFDQWREAMIRYFDVGMTRYQQTCVAVRGDRLALMIQSTSTDEVDAGAPHDKFIQLAELDHEGRFCRQVWFDTDDIDVALAELDAQYAAREAAPYRAAWSAVIENIAALTPDVRTYVEVVHRLSDVGAVFTYVSRETVSRETAKGRFEAEWRGVGVTVVSGQKIGLSEQFEREDLELALARFDELSRPTEQLENAAIPTESGRRVKRLENTASRVYERYLAEFTAGDWDAMADTLAVNVTNDDRRRVINGGVQRGRDAVLANMREIANVGVTNFESSVLATRGERLALGRYRVSGGTNEAAFGTDVLLVIEIDSDGRFAAGVAFDPDDADAAFDELDSRYLTGDAAPCRTTWSAVVRNCALTDCRTVIESVHRVGEFGAVVTQTSSGRTGDGFEGERREINLTVMEGGLVVRSELCDEDDLGAVLARFEELGRPTSRPSNTASRVCARMRAAFAARDWNAVAEVLVDDLHNEDRRRVVNAGIRGGRESMLADLRSAAEAGIAELSAVEIATRGDRLALFRAHTRYGDSSDAFQVHNLVIAETNSDELVTSQYLFDVDDLDAAIEELDVLYLTGEAAPHSQTWLMTVEAYTALNGGQLPPMTPDCVSVDHRRGAAFGDGELPAYLLSALDDSPGTTIRVAAVHRLTERGAVITHAASGTSREGFEAEWRDVSVGMFDDGKLSRVELFNVADLDAALSRFEELSEPRRLENAASSSYERLWSLFVAGEWESAAGLIADDACSDDRRRVIGAGIRRGRDLAMVDLRIYADVGIREASTAVIAARGSRLALVRCQVQGLDAAAARIEALQVVELGHDGRFTRLVVFDPDELDAAFAELDARYLAGEASVHAEVWARVVQTYDAFNRHELSKTTPDWVNIDHRLGLGSAPGDMNAYVSAMWPMMPDIRTRIEAVHRLSGLGAVFTHTERGTTRDGFDAEWREVALLTFDDDAINRCELFDESDLDTAMTTFDGLSDPPRLENAASRAGARLRTAFAARHWDEVGNLLSDDHCSDDRRSVVNAGIRRGRASVIEDMRAAASLGIPRFRVVEIATRGEHLVLVRAESPYDDQPGAYRVDNLAVGEIDAEGRICAQVMFDPDDLDEAFAELDARYLAGEAASCAETWLVIVRGYEAINRAEIPVTADNFVDVDHRSVAQIGTGDLKAYLAVGFADSVDHHVHIETVHRLSDVGAVVAHAATAISHGGLDVEWRMVVVFTTDGARLTRCELFDESDLAAALAHFDELQPRL